MNAPATSAIVGSSEATPDRFQGRVAVVTGGASGMGRATVQRFLADGASVTVVDIDSDRGTAFVDELRAATGAQRRCRFVAGDVCDEDVIAGVVATTVEAFGRLDCFFANAATPGDATPFLDLSVEEWDRMIAVDLRSVFLAIKHAGRALKDQGTGGSIISTASVAASAGGGAYSPAYTAAKAGILGLTRFAAVELAPFGIRVNTVLPGAILTGFATREGRDPDATRARLSALVPWPEGGRPEHIADVVTFLASGDARFVTGESIVVDGGLIASGLRVRARLAEMEASVH
jgi:NAD(P)-dependent dehydrogenase (short-subunit alcohol dehydrogenase family)